VAGLEAVKSKALMLGVRGPAEVGRGLLVGLLLPRAPFHEQAVAETPEHPRQPDRPGPPHPAGVFPAREILALVQAVFNAPHSPIVRQPPASGI
jgi:hypothetical protein